MAVRIINNVVYGTEPDFAPTPGGIGIFMFNSCKKFAKNICQINSETDESETFENFKNRSVKLAIQLKNLGVKKGDVIMMCTPNVIDGTIPATAAVFLGGIIASLDPSLSERECIHLIKISEPKFLFVHENFVNLIEGALKEIVKKPEIVVLGKSDVYTTFSSLLVDSDEEQNFLPTSCDQQDTGCILFSSGTTGLPKGICLSHYALYAGAQLWYEMTGKSETHMHFTTIYWVSALIIYFAQFVNGAKRILVPPYNPKTTFKIIQDYKVETVFMASSLAYKILDDNIEKYNTKMLKYLVFGGGPVRAEQLEKVLKVLPHVTATCAFGMSEVAGYVTGFAYNERDLVKKYKNSSGRPVKGINLKVVDIETEEPLGPNQTGEIRIDSLHKMSGYYNQDASSAFDKDGFLITGDVGQYDENGCVYVFDRIKDMFKYQSWHIVPAAIEGIIKEHPDIQDAVVFGIPTEEDDHIPAAAITLKPESKVGSEDIKKFVEERVLDRQKLRGGVYIFDKIPKTPSDKISRKRIQEAVLEQINGK